jgi:hypothetical protein
MYLLSLLQGMCYAHQHRVSNANLPRNDGAPALTLPASAFLPDHDVITSVRQRMIMIVTRIIAKHLPTIGTQVQRSVIKHIPHENSSAMKKRSKIVCIPKFV